MSLKTVLITGASGNIGSHIAHQLADTGNYRLALHYFENSDSIKNLAKELANKGATTLVVKADLANAHDVTQMFNFIRGQWGTVEALVNNAAIDGGRASAYQHSAKLIEKVMAVNFFGAVNCIGEALPDMKINGEGAIVNISSQAAIYGGHLLAHYAASKGALNSYVTGVAREVIKDGIRINTVSPGPVASEESGNKHNISDDSLPIGRLAKPDEVANTVVWLLSQAASYISGTIVPVTAAR
ncbi:SDR family NAD(P)-dependent oxidoreductase [Thalassotalea euphylliae]|uniref:SDR family oxidoreductase n=1 Tax=Thalassotalea euphylliae TaxID=1655234 RepID=A0A3E0UE30_9GAMM|nr:SDR family oxidoreductase [Thalassotalea euphylliae]REL34833.1 SDR family oxidoreductase [Thalassotalea euphylliae]